MGRVVPILLNQVVGLVLGLSGVVLMTRWVSTEVYGNYQVHFISLCQVGILLTHPGIVNHASRYWSREQGRAGEYAQFLWRESWSKMPLLLLLAALAMCMVSWKERSPWWLAIVPVMAFCNVVLALEATAKMVANVAEQHWRLFWLNVVGSAARVAIPLVMVMIAGASFSSLWSGFFVHAALVCGLIYWGKRAWMQNSSNAESGIARWRTELVEYGTPFIWLGVGNWLLQFADRWLISLVLGESKAGLFSTASGLSAYVPNVILGAMMQWVFPSIFNACDQAKGASDWREIASRCTRWTVGFVGISLSGLLLLQWVGPRWMRDLLGREYWESWTMVFASGMAAMTLQINQFYFLLLQGQHNSVGMVKVMMVVAGVKTLGSAVTLLAGWDWFLLWLCLSMPLCGWLGRVMIFDLALAGERKIHG